VAGRRIVLQVLWAGDVFGDVPLLVRMAEPFDARALEDCVVLSADSVSLFRLLERRPRLAQRWLVSLALRMAATQARLVDLLAGGLDAQVAALLVRQSEHNVVRLSQAVLADMLGARRTSVNRVLKRFEARGLVRLGYGQVEILDPAGLLSLPDEAEAAPDPHEE
jgi:CRP-like cAMP-binding protein